MRGRFEIAGRSGFFSGGGGWGGWGGDGALRPKRKPIEVTMRRRLAASLRIRWARCQKYRVARPGRGAAGMCSSTSTGPTSKHLQEETAQQERKWAAGTSRYGKVYLKKTTTANGPSPTGPRDPRSTVGRRVPWRNSAIVATDCAAVVGEPHSRRVRSTTSKSENWIA